MVNDERLWQVSVMMDVDAGGRYVMTDALDWPEAEKKLIEIMSRVANGSMIRVNENTAVSGRHVLTAKIVPYEAMESKKRW